MSLLQKYLTICIIVRMNINLKKLTILIDERVYTGIRKKAGRGNMGKFISKIVKPYVLEEGEMDNAYMKLSGEREREENAQEWSEFLMHDKYEK